MIHKKYVCMKYVRLTLVLDQCSCCHMIHILAHHMMFHSRHHTPETEGKCLVIKSLEMEKRPSFHSNSCFFHLDLFMSLLFKASLY